MAAIDDFANLTIFERLGIDASDEFDIEPEPMPEDLSVSGEEDVE